MRFTPATDGKSVPLTLGGVEIRTGRGQWIAQAKRKANRWSSSALRWAYRKRFAIAGRMASSPNILDYETAREMAQGTEQVPRDILTMAALGTYYIIENSDGSEWRHVQGAIYDPPTNDPGPRILWREYPLPWEPRPILITQDSYLLL